MTVNKAVTQVRTWFGTCKKGESRALVTGEWRSAPSQFWQVSDGVWLEDSLEMQGGSKTAAGGWQ